ncbi:MAG: primosomal protein N' [SAR324 cluster bacterium]|nr:primosomal protein N' [SAR324 cluster bacterium]
MMIIEVAFNLPLRQNFDYEWPAALPQTPQIGLRVLVPFGPHKKVGVIVKIKSSSEFPGLKKVESTLDEKPVFSQQLLELTHWVAEYYFCGWGEVLSSAIPGGLNIQVNTIYHRNVLNKHLSDSECLSISVQQLVESNTSWSLQEWRQASPSQSDQKYLKQWLQNKEIESNQTLVNNKKNKPKMERWTRLINAPSLGKKHSRRKQTKREKILLLLLEHQEISLAQLKDHVAKPAQVIKQLKEENAIEMFEKRVYRRFLQSDLPAIQPFQTLSTDQEKAYQIIKGSIENGKYNTYLLHGVTGSGKTEIYLHSVRETLAKEKQCLILVPEISLTPQLVDGFRSRFGDKIAVLHSGMGEGERFDEWSRVVQHNAPIVIGARSAVFAPLENIGLIIVDEEHDSSYKQEETPRYNGRDIAVYRGYSVQATVILGSATPSLESCYNVTIDKFHLLSLPTRIHQLPMPEVTLINLKNCVRQKGCYFFSVQLVEAIRQRLQRNEQTLLFLNRRGYASLVQCEICQEAITCPNCSLSLVYHQNIGILNCHQCNHSNPIPKHCPSCHADQLKILGIGTEQIESELHVMFPEARILRLDRDTLRGKFTLGQMLNQIRNHDVDIVIGTQLVTKGHDFPKITLVGVILADLSLNFPDIRSAERTFQILTQVGGRAGRANLPGDVLIQTYNPGHHSLCYAKMYDFEQFKIKELNIRKQLSAPPFFNLAIVLFSSPKENRVKTIAHQFHDKLSLRQNIGLYHTPPFEAPIKKINKRFRWMIILKAAHIKIIHYAFQNIFNQSISISSLPEDRVIIDINPYNFL